MNFYGCGDGEQACSNPQGVLKKIGTHDGTFHADEVLACAMLKRLPEYREAEIIRSRDENILRECDVVVDVGGVYDNNTRRYDHHQRGFSTTMSMLHPALSNSSIKLSSAGLVFAHFGHRLIENYLIDSTPDVIKTITPDIVDALWSKLYTSLILEIDAIDNGVNISDECRYKIHTNLSSRVGRLNPQWRGPVLSPDAQFELALKLVERELMSELEDLIQFWWPARDIVNQAIQNRPSFLSCESSSQIVVLPKFCPWTSHLLDYEAEHKMVGHFKFVLFEDRSEWRVRAVPAGHDSFDLRGGLHPEWRGLRDAELSSTAQISDCVFVHSSGFIGGNRTFAGAVEMALMSMKYFSAPE